MKYKIVYLTKNDISPDYNFFFRYKQNFFKTYIPFSFVYNKENKFYLFSGFSNYNSIKDNLKYPFALIDKDIIDLFFFHIKKNVLENNVNISESVKIYKLLKNILNSANKNSDKIKYFDNDFFSNNNTNNDVNISITNDKYFEKIFAILRRIINYKDLINYEANFSDSELSLFSQLKLRKKEIESYLKVKKYLNDPNILNKYFSIVKQYNFNRNQFFNFFDKLYELFYINQIDNKLFYYNEILNPILKLKNDTPLNFKQRKIFEIIDFHLFYPYKTRELQIKNYIRSLGLSNTIINFTPFLEEKEFKIIISISKPDDLKKVEKDLDRLKQNIDNIWKIL